MILWTMSSPLLLVRGRSPSISSLMKALRKCATPPSTPLACLDLWSTEKRLTVRKYFNQRLLDADGRFSKNVEYLLTAQQYTVESKRVADDASIMLRLSKGRFCRG